jgi:hypothetical protein
MGEIVSYSTKKISLHTFKPDCKDCNGEHTIWVGGGPNLHEEICPYCHDDENCEVCCEEDDRKISQRESYLEDRKH